MTQEHPLAGLRVILTGGTRGLGHAMTVALVAAGASVAVLARDTARLDDLRRETDDAVVTLSGDAGAQRDLEAFLTLARDSFGGIDMVVANAAFSTGAIRKNWMEEPVRFWEVGADHFQSCLAVNAFGPFFLYRETVGEMMERGWGRLVYVSTNLDTMTRMGQGAYGPGKAASEALTSIMANDLVDTGVTANAVLPGGPADTDAIPPNLHSLGSKLVQPSAMAGPILWLASHASDGVTGKRFKANLWDASLPPEEAVAAAQFPVAWPSDRELPPWAVQVTR